MQDVEKARDVLNRTKWRVLLSPNPRTGNRRGNIYVLTKHSEKCFLRSHLSQLPNSHQTLICKI